ncbi:MAG TPA: S41 family peptidase, partial [Blastocatellia bacterium]|nr:S41 family peptidase [Blastocatellia bacterium]
VVSALKDSPAYQAGIRSGDFIEYIGKLPTRELSLYDIEQLLNGQPGTAVELRIVHRGQSRKVNLTRAKISQPAVEVRVEEPGIGYVKVNNLVEGRANEIRTQVRDLVAKGAQKIVLDLRDSSDGVLKEGVAVANLFVGSGTLARVIGKGGKESQSFEADAGKVVFTGPLVVVTDRSTAGPAEIIAAAVRDQKRGEVVGEKTFGAGSEQQLFSLSDGGALLITTAKYAPNSGKPFMDEPVNPTVKVERPAEAEVVVPEGNDEQGPDEENAEPQPPAPKPEQPAEDVQLKKAIEILKQATVKAQAAQKRAAAMGLSYIPAAGAFESVVRM